MKQFFTSFLTYNFQVNQGLADRFRAYDFQLSEEIIRLANHLLNAHQIWLDRIGGTPSLKSPWEIFPIGTFAERNHKLYDQTLILIDSVDPEEIISFKTFAGAEFEKKVSDILIHVVNHSTYHRGQIAMLMRANGLEPVPSDYIHWVT
ncbi:MAG TPA: DinB family protein [Algoriphagus sp.]|nr:DinB family protein [Algoriphagus sp.]